MLLIIIRDHTEPTNVGDKHRGKGDLILNIAKYWIKDKRSLDFLITKSHVAIFFHYLKISVRNRVMDEILKKERKSTTSY